MGGRRDGGQRWDLVNLGEKKREEREREGKREGRGESREKVGRRGKERRGEAEKEMLEKRQRRMQE